MGKPRLIILIRHAQSEGNKNRDIHQTIPDHRVKLTEDGWQQAYEAGRKLRKMLRADDTLHFFTSPYRRTRETTEGILATLTSDEPEPSPFKRNHIKVYEEPRLREQDFGNFQPCSAEMERMWQERADYGHFFYRIPNGESAADAYDRVSGFNESLWRQFGEDDFASVCVLVTHGLMSRVFLMKWYHFSVEYFEDLRNVNHCEFLIMRKSLESGKYKLETKLRTWSELRRERAAQLAKEGKDGKENGTSKASSKLDRASSQLSITANAHHTAASSSSSSTAVISSAVEVRRRWGGCPNGCNHDKSFKIRQTLADLVQSDITISSHAGNGVATPGSVSGNSSVSVAIPTPSSGSSSNGTVVNDANGTPGPSFNGTANNSKVSLVSRRPAASRFQPTVSNTAPLADTPSTENQTPLADGGNGPQIDVTKARDEVVSSPDGTPSFISVEDRLRSHAKSPNLPPQPRMPHDHLHLGRDFGGTYSGHNSVVASDADSSEDDDARRRMARLKPSANGYRHHSRDQSGMGRGARANRLGDHPHSSDGEHEADGEAEPDHDCGHGIGQENKHVYAEHGKGQNGPEVEDELERKDEQYQNGLSADDALAKAEKEDRSIRGSVY
ncbi:broad-range acid phosphatase DET1 [Diplogelasinospora grovesii]|uniref:Broad-range acid phosphatase DET1 n=1 Tax=Diplogelasinospora grovesii TaxID=303347 RepID=A0AAN6NEA2_9PEZI|nr:broad-range acid phosphatase DET1 [Diplogelasinospora grovesii]